jgi:hypothetical protein
MTIDLETTPLYPFPLHRAKLAKLSSARVKFLSIAVALMILKALPVSAMKCCGREIVALRF